MKNGRRFRLATVLGGPLKREGGEGLGKTGVAWEDPWKQPIGGPLEGSNEDDWSEERKGGEIKDNVPEKKGSWPSAVAGGRRTERPVIWTMSRGGGMRSGIRNVLESQNPSGSDSGL